MQKQGKAVVLDRLDDAADVGVRELLGEVGREKTGQGLGHEHAVGAGILELEGIVDEEGGHLVEHAVHQLGLVIAEVHDLVDVHQAARQREGADVAGDDGLVVKIGG